MNKKLPTPEPLENVWKIDYHDLQTIIRAELNLPDYKVLERVHPVRNDTYLMYWVGREEGDTAYTIEAYTSGERDIDIVLDYMAIAKIIPSGTYIIHISW